MKKEENISPESRKSTLNMAIFSESRENRARVKVLIRYLSLKNIENGNLCMRAPFRKINPVIIAKIDL